VLASTADIENREQNTAIIISYAKRPTPSKCDEALGRREFTALFKDAPR
jgi:hypothetical protein